MKGNTIPFLILSAHVYAHYLENSDQEIGMQRAKVFTYILVFCIMSAIAVGGILLFNNLSMHDEFQNNIRINENGETRELLNFDSLSLVPGEEVGYNVNLQSSLNSDFVITLDFTNTKSGGLEKYVIVETCLNGDKRTFSMISLFEGLNIVYNAELFADNELEFRFYMPDTVGNEAQGKFVDFDVNLIVTNEEFKD